MNFAMYTCREAARLLIEREHRRLGPLERLGLRLHLGVCRMCTRFDGQLRLMNRAMDRWRHYGGDE